MANDLSDLDRIMAQYANRVERNGRLIVRIVAQAIAPVLVYSTPIDTSRARANWRAGIGSIPSGTLFDKPDKPPSPEYGAITAINAILATAATYAGGSYLAIVNNLSYIQQLNDGYSAQAPRAFVQQAVATGIRSLHRFRILRDVN